MFRRPISHDGDVVAAARRRLEALAAHHDRSGQRPADSADRAVAMSDPVVAGSRDDAGQREPDRARHVGARRTELGRWGVSGQQVAVISLCLLLLVILVAWWALRSVPHSDQVTLTSHRQPAPSIATVVPPATGASPAGDLGTSITSTSTTNTGGGRLVVDVAGRVRHPGIVELAAGSRVVDALTAAGGALPGVSLTSLNLARLLVDGEQIVVGVRVPVLGGVPPPGSTATGSGTSSTAAIEAVALNTATLDQLDTLPGIGPVTAQAIVQWRTDNGPFTSVDELLEVAGIGDATLSDVRPYVYV